MGNELRSSAGFSWEGYNAAALYCLQNKTHLADGLRWAEKAADPKSGNGQESFVTLSTLSQLQEANGDAATAARTMDRALKHPTAGPSEIHQYARQLLARKRPQEAMKAFELNARLHPDVWPVHVGLARGYAAVGQPKQALGEAKLALAQAPDEPNKASVQAMIQKLEAGQDIN